MAKVSIIIATFNSMKYLPDFLESIFGQTFFEESQETPDIFVVDNASSDKTISFIRNGYPTVKLLRNVNNIGLCRAWNQGIRMTSGEYVLIMNPDLVLGVNFLKIAVETMDENELIASVGGKLYQLRLDGEEDLFTLEKTSILDSCGIQAFRNRRFIERGAGEVDNGKYNGKEEVFGISGALVLYRRKALERVKFGEEYFDEDFFMYKEDVDMAWRLRLAGYLAIYEPRAIGYHHRRARSQGREVKSSRVISYRISKDNFVNFHSYKNHLMMLKKNLLMSNFLRHFVFIFLYELKKFVYVLIFETGNLFKILRVLLKLRGKNKQKRRLNMKIRKIKPEEMRQWFE
ncbi:MAG: glycosyltransferase family 2 protein [Candidatus Kuenenbacteria bacterium]